MSDEELYRLMRAGRQEAFAELYARHEPALFRYAMHMTGSRESGEEIAHDVFVQLLEATQLYDERRGPLTAYLYGIARNLVRMSRRRPSVAETIEPAVDAAAPQEMLERERARALHDALAQMPVNYRDAVVLCDLEECSYEEAARRIGCPVGTVRSRVHRGRLFLAERLRASMATTRVAVS